MMCLHMIPATRVIPFRVGRRIGTLSCMLATGVLLALVGILPLTGIEGAYNSYNSRLVQPKFKVFQERHVLLLLALR